ncbi:S8 family serine peptidase [Phaeobacter sp.]|uniref:S8 family serine peptidase n=1 Tax=Phaeobacter sp. TaxID=1902409 RepID=UPI0025F9F28E|nr:S8 family serine peptidase [Phaeobacter sp.]
MFASRSGGAPDIHTVLGPYERWVFSQELGRPFSFSAISSGIAHHYSALLDRPGQLPSDSGLELRVPPMWSANPAVTPFAMYDPASAVDHRVQSHDEVVADMVGKLGQGPFRVNLPIDPLSWPQTYDDQALPDWDTTGPPPRAIVAVIDDGLPFAHKAFLNANGASRLACCWLQAARADDTAAVPFGKELSNRTIDTLRAAYPGDEPGLHRAAGAIDTDLPEMGATLRNHSTHGAHIMGLAAGNAVNSGAEGLPDDIAIIAVQLPNTVAWDTSGFGKEASMLAAVEYVFHRARALAQAYGLAELPLVVNFSYGWSATGHDGATAFETAVQQMLEDRRRSQPHTAFVVPAGNHFEDRMHARLMGWSIADQGAEIGWWLSPDDRTSSFLELWCPSQADLWGWSLIVTAPDGLQASLPLEGSDPTYVEMERAGGNIAQLSADTRRNGRRRVIVAVVPTTSHPRDPRRAASGTWTLTVAPGATPLDPMASIDIWVQRDDDPVQLGTGGRQSRLVFPASLSASLSASSAGETGPSDGEPLPVVRGYGALNGIGNAASMLRVAGRVQTSGQAARYSSGQAIRQTAEGVLSLSEAEIGINAVSDQGVFRPGLPSIATLSGGGSRLIGTSAAAATVTREIARNMAAGRDMMAGFPEQPQRVDIRELARLGRVNLPVVCL